MITVRFLSGEIWEIPKEMDRIEPIDPIDHTDHTDRTERIQRYLAERLHAPPHRIHLQPLQRVEERAEKEDRADREVDEKKGDENTFFALVRPPPTIQLTDEHLTLIDWQTCTHPDLLDLLLQHLHRIPPYLLLSTRRWSKVWANPHPPLVHHLIGHLDRSTFVVAHNNKRYMNHNPNDEMIDRILHTSLWLPEVMCMNTNLRAVRICLSHFEELAPACDPIDCVYKRVLSYTTDPDVFEIAFAHSEVFHPIRSVMHHITFVAHHAHLIPRIGDLLLEFFDDLQQMMVLPDLPDMVLCTDHRVLDRLLGSGWVGIFDLGINPSDAAVDWLLSRPFEAHVESHFAMARNTNPRAVAFFVENMERIEDLSEPDSNHFWERFVHNPSSLAIDASIEWIIKKPSTRVKWFLEVYQSMRVPNTRLVVKLYDRLPDSFPCSLVQLTPCVFASIGLDDIRFVREVKEDFEE